MAAVARLDARAARHLLFRQPEAPNLGDATTAWTWGGGRLVDSWPAAAAEDDYRTVRTSDVETLLIGGEVDFAAPPQGATEELLPHLPNGRRVVLPGFGHSTSADQPEAGHTINTYLASGEVDDSRYEPQRVDFTPEVTQTALGKGVGGAIVGFALLTVLSLLWMAGLVPGGRPSQGQRDAPVGVPGRTRPGRLVHGRPDRRHHDAGGSARRRAARGALGRRADRPGDLLGLGSRDVVRPDQDRGIRGGTGRRPRRRVARVQRDDGPPALITAIVGATVGANLLLIALDIARARSLRDRPAAPASSPVPSGSGA